MIVWGTGSGQSTLGEAGEFDCPACGEKSTFSAIVNYSYFHIWWLFSFLIGRKYFIVCDSCQNGKSVDKSMIRSKYAKDNIPFIRRRGWLLCFGAIVAFFALGAWQSAKHTRQLNQALAAPAVGDIYLVNLAHIENSGFGPDNKSIKDGKAFGTLKLLEMEGENLTLATSFEAYNKQSTLTKTLKNDPDEITYDHDDPVYLTLGELRDLRKRGSLFDVRRD